MTIEFRCENEQCGTLLRMPDASAGKRARCPRCARVQTVPAASAAVAEAPARRRPESESVEEVSEVQAVEEDAYSEVPRNRKKRPSLSGEPRTRVRRSVRRGFDCPYCEEPVEAEDEECPDCGRSLDPRDLHEAAAELKQKRWLNNLLSFAFGVPGLVLIIAGAITQEAHSPLLGFPLVLLGAVLLWVGIGFGVAYKRYNLAWILLGLVGILGLIILAVLPDEKGKQLARLLRAVRGESDDED